VLAGAGKRPRRHEWLEARHAAAARLSCGPPGTDELLDAPLSAAPGDCETLVLDGAVRFGLHPRVDGGRAAIPIACVLGAGERCGLRRAAARRPGARREREDLACERAVAAFCALPALRLRAPQPRRGSGRVAVDVVLTDNIIGGTSTRIPPSCA